MRDGLSRKERQIYKVAKLRSWFHSKVPRYRSYYQLAFYYCCQIIYCDIKTRLSDCFSSHHMTVSATNTPCTVFILSVLRHSSYHISRILKVGLQSCYCASNTPWRFRKSLLVLILQALKIRFAIKYVIVSSFVLYVKPILRTSTYYYYVNNNR